MWNFLDAWHFIQDIDQTCFSQIFCNKYISSRTPYSKISFENRVCIWLSIFQVILSFIKYLSPLLISIISYLKNCNFHKTAFTEHFSCWCSLYKDKLCLFLGHLGVVNMLLCLKVTIQIYPFMNQCHITLYSVSALCQKLV